MKRSADAKREFLRHTVATLAYRGEKAICKAPKSLATTRAGPTTRSGLAILAHIGDLLDWVLSAAKGKPVWRVARPRSWQEQSRRFFVALKRLDDYLASGKPLANPAEKLFQGGIADALTHVGQLATLRRLVGSPMRGESYYRAQIVIGRVGPRQSGRRVEFD